MEQKTYTITIYSENQLGLLNRVTGIFLRRHIDMESINVSKSEIDNVFRMIIVTHTTQKWVEHIVKQIEKQIEIIKVFYHTDEEIISLENSLFKMSPTSLFDEQAPVQTIIQRNNATIAAVYKDFYVISKTGTRESIEQLYKELKPYGIMQFSGSARIAVSKAEMNVSPLLNKYEVDNQK
ncbi:acetolactate synthase small subunit [Capnocytophaga felis]|uniref:Acetolactate synthase small subunit n=1 Tax=Capnocytophaga felis TaxID=2267611 RepID=A0A5M4B776_9FLAO|nr:acetolactate synthase small subunit [Capnocytophaga felis]GET45210.1 acetolactate synthase small subunit [Capnocytophaga felis]GET47627.1 acetolactate synthase small subunit [Capnocytophaga felis]